MDTQFYLRFESVSILFLVFWIWGDTMQLVSSGHLFPAAHLNTRTVNTARLRMQPEFKSSFRILTTEL